MLACGLISFWLWHEPRDGGNRKSGPSCTCAVWWPAARKRDCVWRCWGLGRRRHVQAVTSLAGCGHRHATRDLSINISAVVPRYWQILQISTRLSGYQGIGDLYCIAVKALRYGSHSFTCKLHRICLYLVSVHQMALTLIVVHSGHLIAATTHLSTLKGWKAAESPWLADLQRTVYRYKWSLVSCRTGKVRRSDLIQF